MQEGLLGKHVKTSVRNVTVSGEIGTSWCFMGGSILLKQNFHSNQQEKKKSGSSYSVMLRYDVGRIGRMKNYIGKGQ